jgi:hypothetical protein
MYGDKNDTHNYDAAKPLSRLYHQSHNEGTSEHGVC